MKNKKTRKKVIKIIAVIVVVAIVIVGVGLVLLGKARSAQAGMAAAGSVRSYAAKYGTISTTVSGTGTLEADDVENIDLLSLVEVDTVYVKAGDTVYYSYAEKESSGFSFGFGTQQMMPGGNREQMRGSGSGSGKTNMPQQ